MSPEHADQQGPAAQETTTSSYATASGRSWVRRRLLLLSGLLAVVAAVTFGVTALLVTIFEHRQEARIPFVRRAR